MNRSSCTVKHITTRWRRWPHLRCCSILAHFDLLADLEQDAAYDPDLAGLLPRIRYLITGSAATPELTPWWTR